MTAGPGILPHVCAATSFRRRRPNIPYLASHYLHINTVTWRLCMYKCLIMSLFCIYYMLPSDCCLDDHVAHDDECITSILQWVTRLYHCVGAGGGTEDVWFSIVPSCSMDAPDDPVTSCTSFNLMLLLLVSLERNFFLHEGARLNFPPSPYKF